MKLSPARTAIVLGHGLVVWILCGVTMAVGRSLMPMDRLLVVHAALAPVFSGMVAWSYQRLFGHAAPLRVALYFLGLVVVMDAALVAPVFEKSYAMFNSLLGTWIPFLSIFAAALLAGRLTARRKSR